MEFIKEQAQKDMDNVAVELLKGNYRLTEYKRVEEMGYIPTRGYEIVTNRGITLKVEYVDIGSDLK